jgi:hypothetical protein
MQLVSKQARTRNIVAVTTKISGVGTLCLLGAGLMGSRAVAADAPIALVPATSTFAPQTSPLISLDFTRAAVSDILTMIGREGNVDIIIGEDVTGTLKSVHLTDKTADQAIRMVAQSSGIAWKKLDARTYMVGQAAGSSTQNAPNVGTDSSQENMAVPDSSGSSGLEVPLLKPQSKSVDETSAMAAVDLRNVKPTIMAYWLDPSHQPKPVQFQKSDERAKYEGDRFKGIKAMSPSKLMQREDVGDSDNSSSPQTPAWAQPGSGYLPFNPYTQSSRQTGGNTGGGNSGGGGGAGGGSGSSNQDVPASAAATVALPQGVDNIIAIDAQNVLLVRGTDEGLDRIREIISVLDRPIPQVEIETRFVQIQDQNSNLFGISFTRIPNQATTTNGTIVAGDPNAGISISYTSGQITANLNAAITAGRVKVVSAPRVTTFNNLTAQVVSINTVTTQITDTILVPNGVNGSIAVPRTTFFSQVSGVVLTVIPTVNRDGTITMSLQPLVLTPSPASVKGSLFNDISSQEINTSANIKDGDTLAIGGLRTLSQTNQRGKIPFLGDLPIIGPLFRSRNRQDREFELVIFVTAHIVRSINDPVLGT